MEKHIAPQQRDWRSYTPSILLPTFTWPHQTLGSKPLASSIPPNPPLYHRLLRRVCGFIHSYLVHFSIRYCRWTGTRFNNQIVPLPFGLVLKWSDGTRLEEVTAMKVARRAGFPVPKVITYGEHPDSPHAPISILMTRLPGCELSEVYERLPDEQRATIAQEMSTMLRVMRTWPHPSDSSRICSVAGTSLRSVRVPDLTIGPCDSEEAFNDSLFAAVSDHAHITKEEFDADVAAADKLREKDHAVVFTHGDLKHHNIMVHDGHVSGFIDWESAGWYPEYWEFTTALRVCREDYWWYGFVEDLGGSRYMDELVADRALNKLTVDSYGW